MFSVRRKEKKWRTFKSSIILVVSLDIEWRILPWFYEKRRWMMVVCWNCKFLWDQCDEFYRLTLLLAKVDCEIYWMVSKYKLIVLTYLGYYYSIKIFSRFWLPKSARLIHHNQLTMFKFGTILCLTRKWRQNAAFSPVKAPLTEKTSGDEVELFRCEIEKWRTFHSFQG